MNLRRLFLRGLIVSLTATALLAIGVLLFGDLGETGGKIVATTALLSGFSLLGMPGAALLDHGRAVWLGWLTLGLAGYALAHALVLLWTEEQSGWKLLLTGVAFTAAGSQASATTGRLRESDGRWVRILYVAAIAGSVLLAALASFAAWRELEDEEGFFRVLAALAVAVVLTTILQPILRRTAREDEAERSFVLALATAGGREVERTVEAPDFASAAASAIRELERSGEEVVRVERSRRSG